MIEEGRLHERPISVRVIGVPGTLKATPYGSEVTPASGALTISTASTASPVYVAYNCTTF
jgi:ethanolamine utilization protein EutQ (cupin superfamily)